MTQERYDAEIAAFDKNDADLADLEKGTGMTESFEHYASKYYDPVKAHEYYMKTRQLKRMLILKARH